MSYDTQLTLHGKKIRIKSNHPDYLHDMKEEFAIHVKNYFFQPKYKAGFWNGKINFISNTGLISYGLLFDFLRISKKLFPNVKIKADEGVKNLFKGQELNINYNLKYKPRYYQKESVEICLKRKKGIIVSATACHAKGDKIILHTGEIKNIEDIKIGDYVIGKDGNPKKVLNTFNGMDDLYQINPKNKRTPITVTKNHLLHLGFTHREGKYDKRKNTFENISVEDYLNKNNSYKHISKLSYFDKEINFECEKMNCKLSPYFIGLYLGDGAKHSCNITTSDKEIINEIYNEANKFNMEVKNKSSHKYQYFIKGSKNKRNKIFKEFEKIGIIFGTNNMIECENRFIPKIIFNQNIEYRKEVLAGLIDSNGSLTNETYYEFSSKSKQLRDNTELLSISLGLCCSKSEKEINGTSYYRLYIMGNINKIPVKIERKKPKRKSKTNAYRSGFNVEYIGKDNFYGIQVEDSLYLTNNGMITHNSGKSLSISYIIKTLLENKKITRVNRALIIVPTVDLVNQFKDDMISYGIKEKIGIVYSKKKEFDNPIVVSTWQTMKNQMDKLALYQAIIVDEVHKGKALQLKKILSKSNASYRFGFTGTMPDNTVDEYNVKSYLGSILKEYSSGLLAEQEYISKCTVKVINVTYPDIESNTYHQIIGEVFNKEKRLNIIENITNSIGDENILFLVSKIAEGEKLEKLVNRRCKKKKVIFLSGKDKAEIREEWRKKMIKEKNIVVIATFQIFQEGLNIPNLKYALLASSSQSKIRILQSLGRTLRLHKSKKEGAFIFDIVDDVKYLKKHGEKRMSFYEEECHTIEFIKEKEFKI